MLERTTKLDKMEEYIKDQEKRDYYFILEKHPNSQLNFDLSKNLLVRLCYKLMRYSTEWDILNHEILVGIICHLSTAAGAFPFSECFVYLHL